MAYWRPHTLCGPGCCAFNTEADELLLASTPDQSGINQNRLGMEKFLYVLKEQGGPVMAPGASNNTEFLELLDIHLPEIKIYRTGRIQTSPGVSEVEGTPTEYFRTVGAIIALIAAWAYLNGDEFGIVAVSAGARGPLSIDKIPGKFINMGGKPGEYKAFCEEFSKCCSTDEDWWAMMVFLAIHDVGKSDDFRNTVNATLPLPMRSDDHDRVLAAALNDPHLKQTLLPSVHQLSRKRQESLAAGFATGFQLPQLGQGEIACINFRGLLEMPERYLADGTLRTYLYHSIFDVAGATSNELFLYPLAIAPVYMGFTSAMNDLLEQLVGGDRPVERALYFDFLYINFAKSYPEFVETVFKPMAESKVFRHETGLALLRILALTRNTYKNPTKLIEALTGDFQHLVQEMAGSPVGPQIMLYYGPDFLRMGLGEDLTDPTGENMRNALEALDLIFKVGRKNLMAARSGDYQYQLNVQHAVTEIKKAGKLWLGGKQLRELVQNATVKNNALCTEGMLVLS
mmetsp:Transcript_27029/g.75371  ORF Transcript_27029/g.75371 Transcript_27029/m.75371 type:complete len:514 (+) Transcript_27029:84-1625(+)